MKQKLCCAALACASTVTVLAQDRPSPTPASSAIVVQGCLQNADHSGSLGGTPVGTSATPDNAGDIANNPELPPYFILTGARAPGRVNAPSTGTAIGTAGTARTRTADGTVTSDRADSDAPRTYALIGNQNELATHNGHLVEVTGTLVPPVASAEKRVDNPRTNPQAADNGAAGGAHAPGADNAQGSNAFQSGTERIRVASIRPISNSCTR
jgi:hypothetical protein